MNKPAIQIFYTCKGCGLKDRRVTVEARTTEDIIVWMDTVVNMKVSEDHQRMSPHCTADKTDIKIPIGGDVIGGVGPNTPGIPESVTKENN